MTYSVSTSVSCSIARHPLIHEVVDHIEDAARATCDFVKSMFEWDVSVDCAQSKANLAQIRAEIDSVNHQLFISNLHIETLRQALDLSRDVQASLQTRHVELMNCANQVTEQSGNVTELPQEIISYIASFLYWNVIRWEWNDRDHSPWPRRPEPHFEWVKTAYRPASEPLYFQYHLENQVRLAKGSSAVVLDGERPLSVHYDPINHWHYSSQSKDASNRDIYSVNTLLSTTYRWRELYLCISDLPGYSDVLSHCVSTLTRLSLYYNGHNSNTPPPTWWNGFVQRFAHARHFSPVLHSAHLPMRLLTTSGGLFSNVSHLQVDLTNNYSSSELSSTLCNMHHLITFKIWFRCYDVESTENDNQKGVVVKLPFLKELTIGGIAVMHIGTLTRTIDAFECENLRSFCVTPSKNIWPEPEEIKKLLISVHESFPVLKEFFFHVPHTETANSWGPDARPSLAISQSVIQNLLSPRNNGLWLLPYLTTLAIPFASYPDTPRTLADLVTLGHIRRSNEVTARLMYLKFIVGDQWTKNEQSNEIFQSLLMNFHDVEVLQWSDQNENI